MPRGPTLSAGNLTFGLALRDACTSVAIVDDFDSEYARLPATGAGVRENALAMLETIANAHGCGQSDAALGVEARVLTAREEKHPKTGQRIWAVRDAERVIFGAIDRSFLVTPWERRRVERYRASIERAYALGRDYAKRPALMP